MTLRELLLKHRSKDCYNAGWATKTDLSNPLEHIRVAELWLIPIELLNKEVLLETREIGP